MEFNYLLTVLPPGTNHCIACSDVIKASNALLVTFKVFQQHTSVDKLSQCPTLHEGKHASKCENL